MIAILGALMKEFGSLPKKLDSKREIKYPEFSIFEGKYKNQELVLVKTGMGKRKAENATKFVLDHYPPRIVLSIGQAGGVKEELGWGDVVVCQNIYSEGQKPISSNPRLVSLAVQRLKEKEIIFHSGNTLTVPRAILRPEEKRKIGKSFSVSLVEMESYWVALVAFEKQIPFLVVRSISDTIDERFPDFNKNPLLHPRELGRRFMMWIHTRRALKALDKFLLSFLEAV